MTTWPKDITMWHNGQTGYMSIPFTWLLPKAQREITQHNLFTKRWVVGGSAVELMPNYLTGAQLGSYSSGVLQRINPLATRTTVGCPRRCRFCGVGKGWIERGGFRELDDWPNLPILCDSNLLAASYDHFARVMRGIHEKWEWCDFNQGLDARLLQRQHADCIATVKRPIVRLALDSDNERDEWPRWSHAVELLRGAGIAKRNIRSYVLCGFHGSPADDWRRCEFVEGHGIRALPMWFHALDAMAVNAITPDQAERGWTDVGRRQLMGWYYKHRGTKLIA